MPRKMLTILSPQNEIDFSIWYQFMANQYGLNPNPDDPRHFYDYRGAWKERITPTWQPEHQQFRWPDTYKLEGYPYE